MRHNLKFQSEGIGRGRCLLDGRELKGVKRVTVDVDGVKPLTARLELYLDNLEVEVRNLAGIDGRLTTDELQTLLLMVSEAAALSRPPNENHLRVVQYKLREMHSVAQELENPSASGPVAKETNP